MITVKEGMCDKAHYKLGHLGAVRVHIGYI
jgi:hypothetical protein